MICDRAGRVSEINVIPDAKVGERDENERHEILGDCEEKVFTLVNKLIERSTLLDAFRHRRLEIDKLGAAHENRDNPDDDEYKYALLYLELLLERIQYDVVAVEANSHQGYDAHVDAERRRERYYLAHYIWKYPTLQIRRLELEEIFKSKS